MVYGHLNDYIYAELINSDIQAKTEEEKKKIGQVREHFEQEVFPIIEPVITLMLSECFDEFVRSDQVISKFGDRDQFANLLPQFYPILNSFLVELSNELSEILLLPIREVRASEETLPNFEGNNSHLGVKAKILSYLKKEVEIEVKNDQEDFTENKAAYFSYLSNEAISLFKPGNIFGYKLGIGNSVPDLAISSYLNSLTLMGLTETNNDNEEHFAMVLIRCLKRAVETMQEEAVLDMLIRSLEEALANMFWIRTLDIQDFESYWKIFEPLIHQAAYNELEQIKYFGIPNAIISEYFDLYTTGETQENRKYSLPPIDATTPLPRIKNNNNAYSFTEKWIEELRYIFFVPIAQYLLVEEDIFPEQELFQLKKNKALSKDGQLIRDLRENFKQFSENSILTDSFADELKMIEFFKHAS
jgi:hypothetical protein